MSVSDAGRGAAFLDQFLPAAGIDLALLPDSLKEWLEPWLASVRQEDPSFVLPVNTPRFSGFYAGASNAEELRRLNESLTAFVGPSYGTVSLRLLDPGDPVDAAVADYTGAATCLRVGSGSGDPEGRQRLRDALGRMQSVLTRRPPGTAGEIRPLAAVLRDFEWAVYRRDPDGSASALAELEQGGLLSLVNLRFLEYRRLGGLELWEELRHDERFDAMANTPLPRGVADVMLEAVYRIDFAGVPIAADPEGARQRFVETILPSWGSLFRAASRVTSPGALRLAALFAVSRNPVRNDIFDAVLAQPEVTADSALEADLLAVADLTRAAPAPVKEPEPPPSPLEAAAGAVNRGEADLALRFLADAPRGVERAALYVRAAFRIADLGAAQQAREAVDALTADERSRLPADAAFQRELRVVLEDGRLPANAPAVVDWDTWLAAVQADPAWTEAATTAAQVAEEWDGAAWLGDTQRVETFATALAELLEVSADAVARRHVRDAIPALIRFAGRVDPATSRLMPVLEAIRMALVLDERYSLSDLDLVLEVTDRQLAAGVEPDVYRLLIADLQKIWGTVRSAERLDWALAALDSLSRHSCRDENARDQFLRDVGTYLAGARQAQDVHHLFFGTLAVEFDVPWTGGPGADAAGPKEGDAAESASGWRRLDGAVLGIHCLMESASKRVREMVAQLASPRRIVLDESHDCSDALRNLSRSADYLLVVTQHAKHQATNCIDTNAAPSTRIVKAQQSRIGATGLLRALAEALRDDSDQTTE